MSACILNENGTESPFTLRREGEQFYLDIAGKASVLVAWTPPLASYQKQTSSGLLVSDILTVHGDFIAVHPSHPCRFGQSGLSCRYCGSSKELSDHPPFTPRDLVEAIQLVMQEKRCDVVTLSSGHVGTPDGGVERLEKWVTEIRKHVNVLISLDLVPPATNEWIDKTYAMGVDALYYDSDFFNPKDESSREFQKHKSRQLEALAYAAKIFPTGAVLSHLVVGLEPLTGHRREHRFDDRSWCRARFGLFPSLRRFQPAKPLDGNAGAGHARFMLIFMNALCAHGSILTGYSSTTSFSRPSRAGSCRPSRRAITSSLRIFTRQGLVAPCGLEWRVSGATFASERFLPDAS